MRGSCNLRKKKEPGEVEVLRIFLNADVAGNGAELLLTTCDASRWPELVTVMELC
jgi:hypothetical protein